MNNVVVMKDYFEITPCNKIMDIENRSGFKKMELTKSQKIQMGGLLQQLPAVAATDALSGAYTLKMSEGIAGALHPMQYKAGGFGTPLQDANGKIVGHASLQELSSQATVLGMFNIMSIAAGQYFLAQINGELKAMNQSIDKILEFLYGDKKAELMAEISFTKYAYQNYSSIMDHEQQRLATIIGLQEARKIAMKDIEFYMFDLDSAIIGKGTDVEEIVNKAVRIKDCLVLSMQLYSMSSLLEVYYAQNFDTDYICYLEEDLTTYIAKCENRMLSDFSMLKTLICTFKENVLKKVNKPVLLEQADAVINLFGEGKESDMRKSLKQVLHASEAKTECYVNSEGDLYLKTA